MWSSCVLCSFSAVKNVKDCQRMYSCKRYIVFIQKINLFSLNYCLCSTLDSLFLNSFIFSHHSFRFSSINCHLILLPSFFLYLPNFLNLHSFIHNLFMHDCISIRVHLLLYEIFVPPNLKSLA